MDITNICEVTPVTRVTVEVGVFDPALLNAMKTTGIPPKGVDYQRGPSYYVSRTNPALKAAYQEAKDATATQRQAYGRIAQLEAKLQSMRQEE